MIELITVPIRELCHSLVRINCPADAQFASIRFSPFGSLGSLLPIFASSRTSCLGHWPTFSAFHIAFLADGHDIL